MVERSDTKEVLQKTHIMRLTNLRKSIANYEENVNKCNIHETNILAESIGSDIDYLKYADKLTTGEQNQEIDILEKLFYGHMNRLAKCTCVKKIAK